MFLNPTAKPTPRFTPSPRVVFPAPPGSRIAARGSSSCSGSRRAAQRRITSATGSAPVIVWPVGSVPPGPSAFSSRSSTGSISSARASLSICASAAKHVCTAPKPRIAPHGGLFVNTLVASISAFGTLYGPHAKEAALAVTAVELDAYAPPSSRTCMWTQTSRPSRVARCSARIRAGCRCTWPVNDSCRPYTIFTGRFAWSASIAAWICIERSSRPPNAPPTPARWIRTSSSGRPRHGATCSRSTCSHCVAT